MQIDTNAALITALISAVIGFGLAFYIERKLSGGMQKKSQKILTSIAMMSFGYGLMMTLNEVIGFPLQGLQIRYDKLAVSVGVNVLLLPIIFLFFVKLIAPKGNVINEIREREDSNVSNPYRYALIIVSACFIAYFFYVSFGSQASVGGASIGGSSVATYDFYERVDGKNCYSSYGDKPDYSLRFAHKKETGEIFVTAEFDVDGVKKIDIQKMENCSVLDAKNWSCGGVWIGTMLSAKYVFVNGEFSYNAGIMQSVNCMPKIVKR
jgi:hypothetical protein